MTTDGFIDRKAGHQLGGASIPLGGGEKTDTELFVRRRSNRHACQAPTRLAEAERAGWQQMADDVRAHPAAYCTHPRHDDDAAAMAEVLQMLGLRPTPRPVRRSDALTARPRAERRHGRCPVCRRVKNLRKDGTVSPHKAGGAPCDGEGQRPEEAG